MPRCKNCGKDILNSDKDLCPYCGTPHPIEEGYKTMDVTGHIDPLKGEYKLYRSKNRWVTFVLAIILGVLGVEFFYLKKIKPAVISLVFTCLVVGLSVALMLLVNPICLALIAIAEIPHLIFAIYLLTPSYSQLKDGNGEFIH